MRRFAGRCDGFERLIEFIMRKKGFWVQRWSSGLVVMLIVPSLVLAGLWWRQSVLARMEVEIAKQGLEQIQRLAPLLMHDLISGTQDNAEFSKRLDKVVNSLDDAQLAEIEPVLTRIRNQGPSLLDTVQLVQTLSRGLTQSTGLMSVTPRDKIALTKLLSSELLRAVSQATRTKNLFETMASRQSFNLWDRMAAPVQGGQYKVLADQISRTGADQIIPRPQEYSERIIEQLRSYRQKNFALQSAFGAQLRLMPVAQSGSEISLSTISDAHSEFVKSSFGLWRISLAELSTRLDQIYVGYTRQIRNTVTVAATVVLAALALIIILTRAYRQRAIEEIDFVTFHDQLTGLPNRRSLVAKLKQSIVGVSDYQHGAAVSIFHVDLTRFKLINDQHGESTGDEVLRLCANTLTTLSESHDSVYRVGGNEFMFLSYSLTSHHGQAEFADYILDNVLVAARSLNPQISTQARIGVAQRPLSGLVAEDLLNDASIALATAKQESDCGYRIFEPELRTTYLLKNKTERELWHALRDNHIEAWLQPQVSSSSLAIVGAEALVRWVDPEKGLRQPHTFLPIAEEAGFMEELDGVVRRKAMQSIKRLSEATGLPLRLGLNTSAQLLGSEGCCEQLVGEVLSAGLEPSRIDIEILETVAIEEGNSSIVKRNVAELSQHGFQIDLDDFGTGHASISSLRDLHVDRVKIDRSFVSDINTNANLQLFTNALIQLSKSLGISVLAEGVERREEIEWLRQHGCQYFQGYFISKPVPEDQFLRLLLSAKKSKVA